MRIEEKYENDFNANENCIFESERYDHKTNKKC